MEKHSKAKKKKHVFLLKCLKKFSRPARVRAVSRFIPMVWIDQVRLIKIVSIVYKSNKNFFFCFQTITLNEDVVNRLRLVSRILYGGQQLYESLGLTYIFIGLLCFIGLISLMEYYLFTRKQTNREADEKNIDEQEKLALSSNDETKA